MDWDVCSAAPSRDRIRDYALGAQVTETFNLTWHFAAPAYPGNHHLQAPEATSAAVAQAMIMERWSGIDSRDAFITRQNQVYPAPRTMPDQRRW